MQTAYWYGSKTVTQPDAFSKHNIVLDKTRTDINSRTLQVAVIV